MHLSRCPGKLDHYTGWSAGQREKVAKINCTGSPARSLDDLCCIHDKAYMAATGKHDEVNQKLQADIVLMNEVNKLDRTTLTLQEKVYIAGIKAVFAIKIGFVRDNMNTVESSELLQAAMKEVNSDIENPVNAFWAEKIKAVQDEFSSLEKQFDPQKKPSSKNTASSQDRFAENQAFSSELLIGILTPDILFNAELLAQHQFASAQQKEWVKGAVLDVLHAQLPSYDKEEMDFLFKPTSFVQKPASPSASEDEHKPSRARNYV